MGIALLHGALAASGLVALIVAVTGGGLSSQVTIALGGFVIAALGGFFLFSFHLRGQALPIPVVVIHGFVAVVSFVILLLAILAPRVSHGPDNKGIRVLGHPVHALLSDFPLRAPGHVSAYGT